LAIGGFLCFGLAAGAAADTGVPVSIVLSNFTRTGGITTTMQADGALRATIASTGDANAWSSTLRWNVPAALGTGEVLWLSMVASNLGPEAINFQAMVEHSVPPYPKIAFAEFRFLSSSNTQIALGTATNAIPATNSQIVLHLGQLQGTLFIRDLKLLRYPPGTDTNALPQSPVVWEGMESNAAWRTVALSNIIARRTSTLRVRAADPDGNPRAGVMITITQRNHRFAFGTSVSDQPVLRTEIASHANYIERLSGGDFEWSLSANALKWMSMDTPSWTPGLSLFDYGPAIAETLAGLGLKQRGHTMLWPSYNKSPAYLQTLTTPQLAAEIEAHVRYMARTYSGVLEEWDVINEAVANRDFITLLGSNLLRNAFIWAREEDPHARLMINEHTILSERKLNTSRKNEYFNMIKWLRDSGAPIGAIGMQGHFCLGGHAEANKAPGISELTATLDHFGSLGLPIRITEFDHNIRDEAAQAAYLRDLLTLVFSHASTDGFILWGFWDGWHWKNNAPFYRVDWSEKPALAIWRALVRGAWWTDQRVAMTDTNGWAEFINVFHGDFAVEAPGFNGRVIAHAPGVTSAVLTQTVYAAWLDQHGLAEDQPVWLDGEWFAPHTLFIMGVNPAGDGSDLPRGRMARPGDAAPHVQIWGHSGRVYRLQWSADLADPDWQETGSVTSAASELIEWHPLPAATSAYFRIGIELKP
jgi:GH35 family endo-1,4-beta-xylanase